jgi:hypothetical protein
MANPWKFLQQQKKFAAWLAALHCPQWLIETGIILSADRLPQYLSFWHCRPVDATAQNSLAPALPLGEAINAELQVQT